jgi:diacylglycerol O-acyltransferase / wax synthase
VSAAGTISSRLSPLDGSFLRLESSQAHMHVGWSAIFSVPDDRARPTLQALRRRVAARLDELEWCRWRLQPAPLGLSEPRWVKDHRFDLAAHVRALSEPDEPVGYGRFAELRDALLSEPLDHARAPWEIWLVPRLEDGRMALVGKIHHALVDGIAALQIFGLVLDTSPDAGGDSRAWSAGEPRERLGWAVDELTHTARAGAGAMRATASAAMRPLASVRRALHEGRQALSAARADLLPAAPDSPLDAAIGPRRTLVGYHASRARLRDARAGVGGTLNDIGLALVAGALRRLAIDRGEVPREPLKVMVPVSMRRPHEAGPGNRISMVYVQLPVDLESATERLKAVRAEMQTLKASDRAEGTAALYAAGGLVPAPLRSPVVKALASPRMFNLTISQSPAPRGDVHVLGCELDEVYSVVPIAQRHSLAIGMVRYRRELFIGCYADPVALPEVHQLPAMLDAELETLAGKTSAACPLPPASRSSVRAMPRSTASIR